MTSFDKESQNIQVSFFENPEKYLGTNVFNPGIFITTSVISKSDFDLNKDYSNLRSNFIPSNVLIEYDAKKVDLWKIGKSDWSLCFFLLKFFQDLQLEFWDQDLDSF